jgi:hypothetical protein
MVGFDMRLLVYGLLLVGAIAGVVLLFTTQYILWPLFKWFILLLAKMIS